MSGWAIEYKRGDNLREDSEQVDEKPKEAGTERKKNVQHGTACHACPFIGIEILVSHHQQQDNSVH